MKTRAISILLIVFCLAVSAAATVIYNRTPGRRDYVFENALSPAPYTENPLAGIQPDFTVDDSFSSHLPIIILYTNGIMPPVTTRLIEEEERFVAMEGVEPYVDGVMRIIDGDGPNRLDSPASSYNIRLKRRGNSSMEYEKAQYLVKTVTESGQDDMAPLLGMPAECEWVLNGSMADKSMMRNYLVYRTASEFMPFTPRAKYCEVVYRGSGGYSYEGVYLLIESVKQGESRVNIPAYKENDPFPSYIVRRDRLEESDIMLDTYATANQLSEKHIGLIYPGRLRANEKIIRYAEDDISRIEKMLYSDNYSLFSAYPRYIDVDSFIDYFLLNEFFGNYDAGLHSTYMYKGRGSKLKIGPVWDFDNALDNYIMEPLNIGVTAFQTRPWFDRLMKDATFIAKLEKRYAVLRSGPLSDLNIISTLMEIEAYLGPAIDREWTRWAHYYKTYNKYSMKAYTDEEGDRILRDTEEFRQEVYRLATSITLHGKAVTPRLEVLKKSADVKSGIESRR